MDSRLLLDFQGAELTKSIGRGARGRGDDNYKAATEGEAVGRERRKEAGGAGKVGDNKYHSWVSLISHTMTVGNISQAPSLSSFLQGQAPDPGRYTVPTQGSSNHDVTRHNTTPEPKAEVPWMP